MTLMTLMTMTLMFLMTPYCIYRGAVGFSLVTILDKETNEFKDVFQTATLVMIFVTTLKFPFWQKN